MRAYSESLQLAMWQRERFTDPPCSAIVLEKVCEYLYYNERNKDAKDVPKMEIPMELSLELLIAGDFLNSKCIQSAPKALC